MYVLLSWKAPRAATAAAIRGAVFEALAPFQSCTVHDTLVVSGVGTPGQAATLRAALDGIAASFPGEFDWVAMSVRSGTPFSANTAYDRALASAITGVPVDSFPPLPTPPIT